MKISNKWLIIGGIIIGLFIVVYEIMKYTHRPDITVHEEPGFTIIGKYYEGGHRSSKLRSLFREMDSLAGSRYKDGISAAVFYNDPRKDDKHGPLQAFVGVIPNDTSLDTPLGWEKRQVKQTHVLRARIEHTVFQVPLRVYKMMEKYAEEEGFELGEFSIERFMENGDLIVEISVIENG
jgi:hypothetical protein